MYAVITRCMWASYSRLIKFRTFTKKAQGWDTSSLLTHITSRAKTVQSLTAPHRKQQKSHAVLGSSLRPTASNSAKTVNGHNFFPLLLLLRRLRAGPAISHCPLTFLPPLFSAVVVRI